MTEARPLFASERLAARLLDMSAAEFRRLVGVGALPGPIRIGPHERWNVKEIEAILSGAAMSQDEPEW
ncbi:hypothetical protein [Wenxinia saemankumensis]|uniref:Transcriptional regulator, AlpA family n=1 Tax=Wenxinia saemankumensis TaxID=1447782 RepID=A0A1M6EYK5_9RHOB|nr:hypothetical protein [Wenxinia saemankumensis]SHI90481.1 hypothetical protein SAMN05444417_2248 [Wenxinia saemankumensis]